MVGRGVGVDCGVAEGGDTSGVALRILSFGEAVSGVAGSNMPDGAQAAAIRAQGIAHARKFSILDSIAFMIFPRHVIVCQPDNYGDGLVALVTHSPILTAIQTYRAFPAP